MKSSVWIIIGALAGLWLWSKRTTAKASGGVNVPPGANIGRIGASIENPAALQDFARSLALASEPRIVSVAREGDNWFRNTWSDGRITITDAAGNVGLDTPAIPSP